MPRTYDGKSDWPWPKEFKAEYEIGGNNPLFNVVVAYANYDKEFGYGQGTHFITAFILMNTKVRISD